MEYRRPPEHPDPAPIVAYASGIWAAGGQAELHVWPGGFHGFAQIAPTSAISQAAIAARTSWVERTLRG